MAPFLAVALVLLALEVAVLAAVLAAGLAVEDLEDVAFLDAVEDALVARPVAFVDAFAPVLRAVVFVLEVDFPASSFNTSVSRLLAISFSNPAVFHLPLIDNPTVRLLHVVLSTV